MADGIRLDLQRALSEGPGSIPNLEPLFAPGAIPPIFDEAPDVGFSDVGVNPETGQGTFTGEPIDLGAGSIGQPVPPVKESRGDRLRALLGNFLQNFGTGLQAASRAPSGAEFAAGFGGALGAGEERRQQKSREELLRANQASREEIARENLRLRQETEDRQAREFEALRIERRGVRAGAERKTFQDVLRAGTQRTADIVAGRKQRVQAQADRKELVNLKFRHSRQLADEKFRNNLRLLGLKDTEGLSSSEKKNLTQFSAAEAVLDSLEESLENLLSTSPLTDFPGWVKANNRFNAEASGFTRLIGRALGEKGVFTDADKADFEELLNPGIIARQLSPALARERIQRIKQLFQRIRERQISAAGGQAQEGGGGIPEGTIIRNPQTGQRLQRRNEQWVPAPPQ